MIRTELCDMLDIDHPILQAPMGPYVTTPMAAEVSKNGGLGILSHVYGTVEMVDEVAEGTSSIRERPEMVDLEKIMEDPAKLEEHEIRRIVELTDAPFGVNVRVARIEREPAMAVIDRIIELIETDDDVRKQLKLVTTSAGDPTPSAEKFKDVPVHHFHVTPTLYHAKKAEGAGCDGIIATGYEGGGHQSYEKVTTAVLVPEVVDAVGIPVVACGGLATGKHLAAAISWGAIGVQMGTRFIATKECNFHQKFKDLVVKTADNETIMTSGMFGPIRLLKNKYSSGKTEPGSKEEFIKEQQESLGDPESMAREMAKYWYIFEGDDENGPVLGGQSCGYVHDLPSIKDLMNSIVEEAEEILRGSPDYLS